MIFTEKVEKVSSLDKVSIESKIENLIQMDFGELFLIPFVLQQQGK